MIRLCDECEMRNCRDCEGDPCMCSHLCECGQLPRDCICDRGYGRADW